MRVYIEQICSALLAVTLLSAPVIAFAGPGGTGGGDMCEDRIKLIRDDIGSWINRGGHLALKLPGGMTSDDYAKKMTKAISRAQAACVTKGDRGFPVAVFGRPKVCRFDAAPRTVTCDFLKFNATAESEQYRLVHHELAGLAGIELPSAADSHYEISNQITGHLAIEETLRLTISPVNPASLLEATKPKTNLTELSQVSTNYRRALGAIENFSSIDYSGVDDRGLCAAQGKLQTGLIRALQIVSQSRPELDTSDLNPAWLDPVASTNSYYSRLLQDLRAASTAAMQLNACAPGGDEGSQLAGKAYVAQVSDMTVQIKSEILAFIESAETFLSALRQNPSAANYTCTTQTFVRGNLVLQQVFSLNPNTLRWLYPVSPSGLLKEATQISKADGLVAGEPAVLEISHDMITDEIALTDGSSNEKKYQAPASVEFDYVHGKNISQSKVICYRQK